MRITKVSKLTGKTHSLEIDVTDHMIERWQGGALIQECMPHLNADEREFIMTGITPREWHDAFGSCDNVHTDDIPEGVDLNRDKGGRTFTPDNEEPAPFEGERGFVVDEFDVDIVYDESGIEVGETSTKLPILDLENYHD